MALLEAPPSGLLLLLLLLLLVKLQFEVILGEDLRLPLPSDIVGQVQLAPRRVARLLRTARIPRAPLGDGYLQERGQRVRLDRSAAALFHHLRRRDHLYSRCRTTVRRALW